jgi:hypothetical protein
MGKKQTLSISGKDWNLPEPIGHSVLKVLQVCW